MSCQNKMVFVRSWDIHTSMKWRRLRQKLTERVRLSELRERESGASRWAAASVACFEVMSMLPKKGTKEDVEAMWEEKRKGRWGTLHQPAQGCTDLFFCLLWVLLTKMSLLNGWRRAHPTTNILPVTVQHKILVCSWYAKIYMSSL